MKDEKELAYRYDLFITPDWRDRFDTLVNEQIEMPTEGRLLDVNCGTGAHALEMAERMGGKGEVISLDPEPQRIEIARAKAQVKKVREVSFEQCVTSALPFADDHFDAVIGDASMLPANEIDGLLTEMVRVARPGARIVLKMITHGSFDEFFSIYWEALHEIGIADETWEALEALINERSTISDVETMAERAGLRRVENFISREDFFYETGDDFINSPMIEDTFLAGWLAIIPEAHRPEARSQIISIIERERHNAPFEISIKATLIAGYK
ncbi:MAG: class I SAM-dependent methyltransferase [Blastocatellia bacterium]|nr:class I SAM-dependent methyltransferase [Blastocatellia bacterium]